MTAKKHFWTKRKIRLLVGIALIVWLIVAYEIPSVWYGKELYGIRREHSYVWNQAQDINATWAANAPPIRYSANITFSAIGDFSVGVDNPISVTTIIYNVNRSDFDTFYFAVYYEYSGNVLKIPPTTLPPTTTSLGILKPVGNGVWEAEGTIAFLHSWINLTGPIFLPSSLAGQVVNFSLVNQDMLPQIKQLGISITLQPQSYTDSMILQDSLARYGTMGSSVVLVFLLPVFESIIPKQHKDDSQEGKNETDREISKSKKKRKRKRKRKAENEKDSSDNRNVEPQGSQSSSPSES